MVKRVWMENEFDDFAAGIDRMAERIGKLDEFGNPKHNNALAQIAVMAGTAFLNIAKEESPYDTGLLSRSHIMSDVEHGSSEGYNEVSVSIFIDPNPALWNEKWGGSPGQYGPKYHRERLQWFGIALQLVDPLFQHLLNDQFEFYFEGFWD